MTEYQFKKCEAEFEKDTLDEMLSALTDFKVQIKDQDEN